MEDLNIKKKSAMVLSGGGAFGAYEVGVIKALYSGLSQSTEYTTLNADIFTGTSVGNFNAAVMAMCSEGGSAGPKRLEDIWLKQVADNGRGNGVYRIRGNPAGYLDPLLSWNAVEPLKRVAADADFFVSQVERRTHHFLTSKDTFSHRALEFFDISSLISVAPFETLVEKCVNPQEIRVSSKTLRVVATNWETGEMDDFKNIRNMTDDELRQAIMASAAIPGVFPPVTVDPHLYVDGGVVMNTPISIAVSEGATELHIVCLNPQLRESDPAVRVLRREHLQNTLDTFDRVYTAMLATKISEDIETARWINLGLEVLERSETEEQDSDAARQLLRVAGQFYTKLKKSGQLYKKLTIHRYFPSSPLGGMLGMLNFGRKAIEAMIEEGYRDARAHNCRESGCLIPAVTSAHEIQSGGLRAMTATAQS